jgi:hypothetical protein
VKLVSAAGDVPDLNGDNTWAGAQIFNGDATFNNPSVFSESIKIPIYADAAARTSAIAAPANAMLTYLTDTGLIYGYLAGSWVSLGTSGSFVNASETEAGKVEKGTDAQATAGTSAGETGAFLILTPAQLAKVIQSGSWLYGADAGGDDTYVVALTPVLAVYTTGQTFVASMTTANTGACTIDF